MTNTMTVKELMAILAKHDDNELVTLISWTDNWGDTSGAELSFDNAPYYDTIMECEN